MEHAKNFPRREIKTLSLRAAWRKRRHFARMAENWTAGEPHNSDHLAWRSHTNKHCMERLQKVNPRDSIIPVAYRTLWATTISPKY